MLKKYNQRQWNVEISTSNCIRRKFQREISTMIAGESCDVSDFQSLGSDQFRVSIIKVFWLFWVLNIYIYIYITINHLFIELINHTHNNFFFFFFYDKILWFTALWSLTVIKTQLYESILLADPWVHEALLLLHSFKRWETLCYKVV